MNAEQLLEFLEQHLSELPQWMGEDGWQAFQAALHASVQQMREGMSEDALEEAVQAIFDELVRHPQVREKLRAFTESVPPRLSQPPADTLPSEQRINQVANRFRILAHTVGTAATDAQSEPPKRPEPADRRPR